MNKLAGRIGHLAAGIRSQDPAGGKGVDEFQCGWPQLALPDLPGIGFLVLQISYILHFFVLPFFLRFAFLYCKKDAKEEIE